MGNVFSFTQKDVSSHLRESKTVLDSGFNAVDSGFRVLDSIVVFISGTWVLDPKAKDSGFHR